MTKFFQAPGRLEDGADTVRRRLRIELVGIADEFFLKALGNEIFVRQRKLLTFYLLSGKASAGVTLADTGMALKGHRKATQHFSTKHSVTDVRLCALTANAGRMTAANANIMKHSSLLQKLHVDSQFWMLPGNSQTTVSNLTTMLQQQLSQGVIVRIEMFNNLLYVYHIYIFHFTARVGLTKKVLPS